MGDLKGPAMPMAHICPAAPYRLSVPKKKTSPIDFRVPRHHQKVSLPLRWAR
jgi:hypothetical protein